MTKSAIAVPAHKAVSTDIPSKQAIFAFRRPYLICIHIALSKVEKSPAYTQCKASKGMQLCRPEWVQPPHTATLHSDTAT